MLISLLYVTMASLDAAKDLATVLLEKKLIGCANMFPVTSVYRWQEAIAQDDEIVLLLKTTPSCVALAKEEISARHSYAVPCILEASAQANEPYYAWLCGQVQNT